MLLWLFIVHFIARQGLTAVVAAKSPPTSRVRYLAGRDVLAVLWIGYLYVLIEVLWRLNESPPAPAQVIGYSILLCGTMLRAFSMVALRGFYFAPTAIAQNHAVVRRGPFRRLRHPLYLGLLVELFGLGICAGMLQVTVVGLVMALEIQRQVTREQRILKEHLGVDYEAFCSSTWDITDLRVVRILSEAWEHLHDDLFTYAKYLSPFPIATRNRGVAAA